ncbi:MAG: transporter related [Devosia sp.]|uniref:sugar ABC transporter ATP-binding protein n=1 Tax=Devosia sp. TaxID=1871048 RepID=UPI002618EA19|nr:sugar ABC transporter ATP-binding protein [Devosia sp.]MDB5531330.1 transporter related [Devosia sp.]
MHETPLLASSITRRFGSTVALQDVSVRFEPGTVHALMGANGSGKSTLTKVLIGLVKPDHGEVRLGQAILPSRSIMHRQAAIAAVFQETSLVADMTVEENIWLTREPRKAFGVDRATLRQDSEALVSIFADVAPSIHPDVLVRDLGPDARQIVELLKALSQNPRFIILDEATASLDARQAARMAELISNWRAEGRCVILVTHRMHEAMALADQISVLRNGALVASQPRTEVDEARVVDLMVASSRRAATTVRSAAAVGDEAANLSAWIDLGRRGRGFELSLRKGEILGLAGLQGQGQSQLLRGLFSGDPGISAYRINGRPVRIAHPTQALRHGLALVPGDRNADGLFRILSIADNILMASWKRLARMGWLDLRRARNLTATLIAELKIKAGSPEQPVRVLSGGNAQKTVLARWLATNPEYLLLDDPTKGIDVGARADFYEALFKAREAGMGILVYSSEEHELEALCDRIVVMSEGELSGVLAGPGIAAEQIARAGLKGVHLG